ncbi:MAG: DUF1345 domain-containing protein [Acidimicrobiales bacterium]
MTSDRSGDDDLPTPPTVSDLPDRVRRLEQLLDPAVDVLRQAGTHVEPAWRRATKGEHRWPVTVAIAVAVVLQIALPDHLTLHPRWLLPALELLLAVGLLVANPRHIDRRSPRLRVASIVLIAVISLANAASAGLLVVGLVRGTEGETPAALLATGASIWLTNVIVFALWYWDLDRGGPVARAHALHEHPDFVFPQMQAPELAKRDWEPAFADYFYLSFTNATAFSPTDVMPFSRWAKMTMLLQSAVSLVTVALVIARAVNILR